jgi:6-pyruvoyltetrahydropterin/6-carboxytetrahydropterin synthase
MEIVDPTTFGYRIAQIAKRFTFDAAHYLPTLPDDHPCHRMHGHTYAVELQLIGPVDRLTGFVVDYADIAKAWREIRDLIDHRLLNEVPGLHQPTTENLAWWLVGKLAKHKLLSGGSVDERVDQYLGSSGMVMGAEVRRRETTLLSAVRVKESSTTWCLVDVDTDFAGIAPWYLVAPMVKNSPYKAVG